MTRIVFAKDVPAALKSAQTVLVIAPSAFFDERRFPKLLPAKARRALLEVASEVKPGDQGAIGSTLTAAEPRKVIAGVLPNSVSRYNAPARPEGIFKAVNAAGLGREKKPAVVLVLEEEGHVVAALNALGRGFPLYSARSEDAKEKKEARVPVVVVGVDGKPIKVSPVAREVMETARQVARIVDTPPTEMNPERLAREAHDMLAGLEHVKVKEIVGDELLELGLGGIHAVGRSALSAPRLLHATYAPPGATGPHIALVGKGVTFDTGGLHLKGRGMMETMKSDLGGSAAVAGAFRVLVQGAPRCRLSLLMCIAENAIGPGSYKPDDVLTLHSGKTVEINNTDAEGRLLLADGVSYAARVLEADYVLDAATLTGAQLIATGTMHAAVMSNDADLEALAVAAAYASGDLVHPLPFAPELYRAEFKSTIADMKNSVKDRANAQTSCAGQFIYNHLEGTNVRWLHVDLAGPSFRGERGTGFGVALLNETVTRLLAAR